MADPGSEDSRVLGVGGGFEFVRHRLGMYNVGDVW